MDPFDEYLDDEDFEVDVVEDEYSILDMLPAYETMCSYANDIEIFHDDPGMNGPEL